ncbi:hypothetical protein F511_42343 [Dorcoceras hygrometricum]|uniref:Uncharacterized protein n=1 Tax=Dorcoceras hygrometricum TaxID=472368 RepID=A0A2Z6ZZF4_9LAMI|nr:hypothetical protein F511_42343 [Dorcoceras hygrometricum]
MEAAFNLEKKDESSFLPPLAAEDRSKVEDTSPPDLQEDVSGVDKISEQPPPLLLFPLSEREDEWPSLPSRQGMLQVPSIPLAGEKSDGGWTELFANSTENPTVVGMAITSRPPSSSIKRPPPPSARLALVKQHSRYGTVSSLLLAEIRRKNIEKASSPPPVQIEEAEKKESTPSPLQTEEAEKILSPPSPLQIEEVEKKRYRPQKSSNGLVLNTFRNPFSVLEDMEEEKDPVVAADKENPVVAAEEAQVICTSRRKNKRRCKGGIGRMDQNQGTKGYYLLFISSTVSIVSFLLVIIASWR